MGSILSFLIVILAIWAISTWRAQRGRQRRRGRFQFFHPLAFVVGSDDRLSLSRLQAFVWTMAIFGTYAAAWWNHGPVRWYGAGEAGQHADSVAQRARQVATEAHSLAIQADVQSRVVAARARTAAGRLAPLAASTPTSDSARVLVAALRREADAAAAEYGRAADADRMAAVTADALEADATRYKWIAIPAALLALAGISIGSGVFSTLISVGNSSGDHPCVTSMVAEPHAALKARFGGDLGVPRDPALPLAVLYGTGFGSGWGRVRFGGDFADILFWASDGKTVVTAPPPSIARKSWAGTLIVDTTNGKVAYGTREQPTSYDAAGSTASLGTATVALEWSDLFRNDANPSGLDLMKFQMFGWTLIGVSLYLWNFFSVILVHPLVSTLPALDASLVTLTGVSQLAYLTNKGVQGSNVPSSAAPAVGAAAAPPAGPSAGDRVVAPGLVPPSPAAAPRTS
jgi:hypothetical protein